MSDITDFLDDDDILVLRRYQPIGAKGLDRLLTRLKHAVTPTPETRIILTVEIPRGTLQYLQAMPHHSDLGHTGVALNALARAARNHTNPGAYQ